MTTLLAVFVWFVVIFILSALMISVYCHVRTPEVKFVLDIVLFIGVVVHELAHAGAILCVGVVPRGFSIRYRNPYGRSSPHGRVTYKKSDDLKLTFMQGLLVSLAPLFVSTFTFLFMLDVVFNTDVSDMAKILATVIMVSVVFGSYPSRVDLKGLRGNFNNRPLYSLYQVGLVAISIFMVVVFIDLTFLIFPFEVMYYIAYCLVIIGIYLGLKYTIRIFKVIFKKVKLVIKKCVEARQTPEIAPNLSEEMLARLNMSLRNQPLEGDEFR
jgi:hypothetical protein